MSSIPEASQNYWEEIKGEIYMKNLVNKEDRSELLGQVIDVFEDFLCEKNINIFNPNGDANIYGNDYDHMRQKLNETLVNWGLLEKSSRAFS